jgi:hypothetical protein
MISTATCGVFPKENNKQLDQDKIIQILDQSKASEWHDMIIGQDILAKSGIIINFNDQAVIRDTDTIPMKD